VDLLDIFNVIATNGTEQTVAIVDVYMDPSATYDPAAYGSAKACRPLLDTAGSKSERSRS